VRELSQERFAELARRGVALAGYDVPLLFEVGLDAALRPVVVVSASEAAQLERVVARDGLAADAVRARISAQLPLADKKERADFVLENAGTLVELAQQVDQLLLQLRAGASA
jgi:dephospho-CoA kinase